MTKISKKKTKINKSLIKKYNDKNCEMFYNNTSSEWDFRENHNQGG